jgi:hypothetical protein
MSYSGTTAATTLQNPPVQFIKGLGGGGVQSGSTSGTGTGLWFYSSTNGSTEAQAANFFSDAFYLGMKAGDVVIGVSNTGSSAHVWVGVLGAVSTSGAATNASLIAST